MRGTRSHRNMLRLPDLPSSVLRNITHVVRVAHTINKSPASMARLSMSGVVQNRHIQCVCTRNIVELTPVSFSALTAFVVKMLRLWVDRWRFLW